jgi:hypothetical protein
VAASPRFLSGRINWMPTNITSRAIAIFFNMACIGFSLSQYSFLKRQKSSTNHLIGCIIDHTPKIIGNAPKGVDVWAKEL